MLTHALPQLPPQRLYSKDTYFRAVRNDFSQRSRFLTAVRPLPTTTAFFLTKMVYVSAKVKVLYVRLGYHPDMSLRLFLAFVSGSVAAHLLLRLATSEPKVPTERLELLELVSR